jgi:anti-sigma B factor antagonist
MLTGLGRIRNAKELLNDTATPLARRLLDAGVEFLSAVRFDDDWPRELQRAADRVKVRLLSSGDVDASIRAMDEATLDETAEELLEFAKGAGRLAACSRAPLPHVASPLGWETQMALFDHFDVERRGRVVEIRLGNPAYYDLLRYTELDEELNAFVAQERPPRLLVNFSAVQYCSTAVMNALLKAKKRLESTGGRMKLYGMNEAVNGAFQMLNLEGSVFEIHPSEASASQAFWRD